MAEKEDPCPVCEATGDEPCVTSSGNVREEPHARRLIVAPEPEPLPSSDVFSEVVASAEVPDVPNPRPTQEVREGMQWISMVAGDIRAGTKALETATEIVGTLVKLFGEAYVAREAAKAASPTT